MLIKLLEILDKLTKYKAYIMSLAVVVVFIVTYILVLPAFTLTGTEAKEAGGIDVPDSQIVAEEGADSEAITDIVETLDLQVNENTAENESETKTTNSATKVKVSKAPALKANSVDLTNAINLTDYLDSAKLVVDGQEISSPWTVVDGTKYDLRLQFKEDTDRPFPNDDTPMYYRIPDGIDLGDTAFTQTFTIGSGADAVNGNVWTYDPETKTIAVVFNTQDPNFPKMVTADDANFYLDIEAEIDSQKDEIEFSDTVKVDVVDGTPHDFNITKAGTYNHSNGTVDYVVRVTSTGTNKNVIVTDTITGTALHLIQPVKITGNTTSSSSDITTAYDGDSFTTTIPEMRDGEVITIRYSASIDYNELDANHGTVDQTKNNVDVSSGNAHDSVTTDVHNKIDFSPVTKSAGRVATDGNKRTIPWTLTVNNDPKVAMGGKTVTDEIGTSSRSFMKYSGDGIKVVVTDANGAPVRTDNIGWDDLTSHSDSSWTYTIPETDTEPYKYVITYETEADMTGHITDADVSNTAGTEYDSDGDTQHVDAGEDEVTIKKRALEVTSQYITWESTFTVPKNGLDEAVFTDTYPRSYLFHRDTLGEITVDESTLLPTERYTIDTSNSRYAIITFEKQVGGQWVPGLQATDVERTIKINIKTNNDQDWVSDGADNALLRPHTNNVSLKVKDEEVTASDFGEPTVQKLTKDAEQVGTVKKDGEDYPVFKYTLHLTGVNSDSITIADSFDSHLRFYGVSETPHPDGYSEQYDQRIVGGDILNYFFGEVFAPYKRGNAVVNPSVTGNSMTFDINNVPKNGSEYYPVYELVYYMVVKDKESMKDVAQTSLSNNCYYNFDNTAGWSGLTDDARVHYLAYPMSKKAAGNANQANDFTDTFTIVLNPNAIRLNNGEDIKVEDTLTNLNVDFSTINITMDPPRDDYDVDWTFSDNVGTFWIPDETKVTITYQAQVVGEAGERVAYSNTARMLSYHSTDGKTVTITGRGGGGYSPNYHVRLFKYENNTMNKPLAGASFQLYNENRELMTYQKDSNTYDPNQPISHTNHKIGDPVTFTTDSNGYTDIRLYGDDQDGLTLGWMTDYYLYETVVPEGYEKEDIYWHFKIGTTDSSDLVNHIYTFHSGGILKVSNESKGGLVIEKSFDGNAVSDADKNKISFIVTGVDASGETIYSRTIGYSEFSGGQYHLKSDRVTPETTFTVVETNADVEGYTRTTTVKVDESGQSHSDQSRVVFTQGDLDNNTEHTISYDNSYDLGSGIVLSKVDSITRALLPGATFSLERYRSSWVSSRWESVELDQPTTGSEGQIVFKSSGTNKISTSTLYRLKETQAPTGYKEPADDNYVYFYWYSGSKPSSSNWNYGSVAPYDKVKFIRSSSGSVGEIEVENTPEEVTVTQGLEINKSWITSEGGTPDAQDVANYTATFKVYRKAVDSDPGDNWLIPLDNAAASQEGWTSVGTYTIASDVHGASASKGAMGAPVFGEWSVSLRDLPVSKYDPDDPQAGEYYVYKVVEESVKRSGDTQESASTFDPDYTIGEGRVDVTNTLQNEDSYELPHTGGIGTAVFYIIGLLLILGCTAILIFQRRSRGEK